MILHENIKEFAEAIRITSDYYSIREVFVEKDYWVTHLLEKLSRSEYKNTVVFKGGTSLSKAYNIINRFSEDIDLAILNTQDLSGNKIKELIQSVEDTLVQDFHEILIEGVTSKGSRFRKTAHKYQSVVSIKENTGKADMIMLEINSFANPVPFEERYLDSMIGRYFYDKGFLYFREKFGLKAFPVNVLSPRKTLVEKLISIIRFSFSDEPIKVLQSKIRHFYDIYFLAESKYCKDYIELKEFIRDVESTYEEDQLRFNEPANWKGRKLNDSPLSNNFPDIWEQLKQKYIDELGLLVYGTLISSDLILDKLNYIIKKLSKGV